MTGPREGDPGAQSAAVLKSAAADGASARHSSTSFSVSAPKIELPKGGGAIRGIGEKFAANPVTGTGSMSVPIVTSPGRSGFGPQLALSYDSGSGNGPFGFGWGLSLPAITRKTDKGLPQYRDPEDSDVFILAGSKDLVPVYRQDVEDTWVRNHDGFTRDPEDFWVRDAQGTLVIHDDTVDGFHVRRYRPRIEGLFARIERWTRISDGDIHWRSISRDNVTTLYGTTPESRIANPADSRQVFSWLIRESYDDKGNAILYCYKKEDAGKVSPSDAWEKNRLLDGRFAQRYLKRILYGNDSPRLRGEDLATRTDWLFEVVFDYSEHDPDPPTDDPVPTTREVTVWKKRRDPFSTFRPSFEVRTYRLCRRVLMFHHFEGELGIADYLVRSTDLSYREDTTASFVESITQKGYRWQDKSNTYVTRSFPPITFQYTEPELDETIREVDRESLDNLPTGVDDSRYQWIDLDSEGLTGALTEQADAWYYKRNLGEACFGPLERVARRPSIAALSGGQQHLVDLTGEGRLALVEYDRPVAGFYTRTAGGDWDNFKPFPAQPNISTRARNLRFIDLTGDGHADILVSEDVVFTWYESKAAEGFSAAQRAPQFSDDERGPKLLFDDATESIFLADLSGDGLTDLVRIRNGEVCYWPNLGYGRFGAKVSMECAPVFDVPDRFDPRRLRLADIDGSGTTDIVYLAADEIRLYFNQSGNSWAKPLSLTQFPPVDSLSSVTVVDLRGNGTACLVWSSPLTGDSAHPMRFIDLIGKTKPHLLKAVDGHMGAKTLVEYAPSTHFYLDDRKAGRPWVTKLPFPVHVVARMETQDLVSNTRLVTTYRYRHGYFDGVEREFRGFACVEQRDAEAVVGEFDLSPVITKTWFHTGAYLEGQQLETFFKDPVNQEYFLGDGGAVFLPDVTLPAGLDADEQREACVALQGGILRQEISSTDGSATAALPFSVSERSYELQVLQRKGSNKYAVFLPHASETIDYHYERNVSDPRVTHQVTLEIDSYGDVKRSVTVAYARRQPQQAEQSRTQATLTESGFTVCIDTTDDYRTPLPARSRTYELTAPALAGAKPLTFKDIDALATAATALTYEGKPTGGQTQKRLIEHVVTRYRSDDLSALLPVGQLQSMALPGESYKQAFTPGLLGIYQSKATTAALQAILQSPAAGYLELDVDGGAWLCSGQTFFSTNAAAPVDEQQFAQEHFFLPHRLRDPFGNDTIIEYDAHKLMPVLTRDAKENVVAADNDLRVLQPLRITDPNGNRSEARYDALGMLVGTAIGGKAEGPKDEDPKEGDSFETFSDDLNSADVATFFDHEDPRSLAVKHLGTATTRIIYDLTRVPVRAASIARETHVSDLQGHATAIQLKFTYGDGFGREAQCKAHVGPGPLDPNDRASAILDPRWVATGVKVYNNKGKPIREYEPYFTRTPRFVGVEQYGVSSIRFYDPLERIVATLRPDHTYEKLLFDAWQQVSYDANDTVAASANQTGNPSTDGDVSGALASYFATVPKWRTWHELRENGDRGKLEKTAALRAANHANTPTVAHFDPLGRHFLNIADNAGEAHETRIEFDIEGNQRSVTDALGRKVITYDYDMLGRRVHEASMEAGERWMLMDATGQPLKRWDSRGHEFTTSYDELRRPVAQTVRGSTPASDPRTLGKVVQVEKIEYGEGQADERALNLRTRVFRHYDSAGLVTHGRYDFKGNLLQVERQVLTAYKDLPDWSSAAAPPALDPKHGCSSTFDALNRVLTRTTRDGSVTQYSYNEASLLKAVALHIRGAAVATDVVSRIDYDAKGQRVAIEYGNRAETAYRYDKDTFRLTRLTTTRTLSPTPEKTVQDLSYTYDPVGNVTHIQDDADIHNVIYFANQRVEPSNDYVYDAVYRLTEAQGREHLGQVGGSPIPHSYNDRARMGLAHPGDGNAMGTYTEKYVYDKVGNILSLEHRRSKPDAPAWTRTFEHLEQSLLEPGKQTSNRLTRTAVVPGQPEPYTYDVHGNMLSMPQLQTMQWDCADRLQMTRRQVVNGDETADPDGEESKGEATYYLYDSSGERVRKITELASGAVKDDRVYLGDFEIYQRKSATPVTRETLHLTDDKQRVALLEMRTSGDDGSPQTLLRYQHGNHLGSACLELDDHARVISYEEYTPYGSTSYQAMNKALTAAAKRYRYTGKERDEETGLNYHSARYYAPWLARWIAADPLRQRTASTGLGLTNLYWAFAGNPTMNTDNTGMAPDPSRRLDAQQSVILEEIRTQIRVAYASAQKATSWDPKKFGGDSGPWRWRAAIGTLAHENLAEWALVRFKDLGVQAEVHAEGTILDLVFPSARLGVEAKWSVAGLMDKPEQQMRQVGALAARGYAYAAVTATERGKPGDSFHLDIRTTYKVAKASGWIPELLRDASSRTSTPRGRRDRGSMYIPNLSLSGFASKAGSFVRGTYMSAKALAKSMLPGAEIYDYAKYAVGGGSLGTGVGVMLLQARGYLSLLASGAARVSPLGLLYGALSLAAWFFDEAQKAYISSGSEDYPPPMGASPNDMGVPSQ